MRTASYDFFGAHISEDKHYEHKKKKLWEKHEIQKHTGIKHNFIPQNPGRTSTHSPAKPPKIFSGVLSRFLGTPGCASIVGSKLHQE